MAHYKKYLPNFKYNKLPLPDNFKKEEITFKIFEDVEHTNNGFQVDIILPFWHGFPLGYHKIMCYPKENINIYLPDAKTYKRKINGWHHEFEITERSQKEYKGFIKYHVNKPYSMSFYSNL